MSETQTQLEVGNVVYAHNYGRLQCKYVIDRVTATQAISGTRKFKREISLKGYIICIGGSEWGPSFWLATPELDEQWLRVEARDKFTGINFAKLPIEKVKQLLAVLNDAPKPTGEISPNTDNISTRS